MALPLMIKRVNGTAPILVRRRRLSTTIGALIRCRQRANSLTFCSRTGWCAEVWKVEGLSSDARAYGEKQLRLMSYPYVLAYT